MTDKPTAYANHRPDTAPAPEGKKKRRPPKPRKTRLVGRVRDAVLVTRARRAFTEVAALTLRIDTELAAMNELRNSPGSPGFEARQQRTVLYCTTHECDLEDCRRRARDTEQVCTCTGDPLPPRSDPTGETAFADPIGRDIAIVGHQLDRILKACQTIDDVFARYQPRKANLLERSATEGETGCQSCARVKGPGGTDQWWNPPATANPTDVRGALAKPMLLCRACRDFVLREIKYRGKPALPSVADLTHRRDHPRGHWPDRHERTK